MQLLVASSDQQRILITGVSDLIGRPLLRHLSENYPEKYYVIVLEQHKNLSPRYQLKNRRSAHDEKILSFPTDRFFRCDVTDKGRLHQIIKKQTIQIIIHLTAVLDTDPYAEKVSHVNIQGTKNVFEARQYSSSSQTFQSRIIQFQPALFVLFMPAR